MHPFILWLLLFQLLLLLHLQLLLFVFICLFAGGSWCNFFNYLLAYYSLVALVKEPNPIHCIPYLVISKCISSFRTRFLILRLFLMLWTKKSLLINISVEGMGMSFVICIRYIILISINIFLFSFNVYVFFITRSLLCLVIVMVIKWTLCRYLLLTSLRCSSWILIICTEPTKFIRFRGTILLSLSWSLEIVIVTVFYFSILKYRILLLLFSLTTVLNHLWVF